MNFEYVIVGAGFSGCVIAERLANLHNKKVLIIEKRNHIGGNCYDFYNDDGILVHKYGPHIFHTNIKEVWDYLSKFTDWHYYQHKVLSYVDGNLVPFPINIMTINNILNSNLTCKEAEEYLKSVASNIEDIRNSKDVIISSVGEQIYEMFFKNYTYKQWGLYPEELESQVTNRVNCALNSDPRYFKKDKYQGVPLNGYTKIFEKLLDNNNISIMLNTDYKDIIDGIDYKRLIVSSQIDYYFDYKFGKLPYRSITFDFKTYTKEHYQNNSVINYPSEYDFTRITEYKYLTNQKHPCTTISFEYPNDYGEAYYPIPKSENFELYKKYYEEVNKTEKVIFIGRLGLYKYFNMDEVICNSLNIIDKVI